MARPLPLTDEQRADIERWDDARRILPGCKVKAREMGLTPKQLEGFVCHYRVRIGVKEPRD